MPQVIVDTSALIAFFVKSEQHHPATVQYFGQNSKIRWIILSSVFNETVTWLRTKISPKASIEIGEILRKEHIYMTLSEADDAEIWEVFCRYNDQRWSYTDCSILVMAQRLKIFQVVSFDIHIRQMAGLGIICLP